MKHLTRILIALVVLAMLASCTPNGATSPTGSPTGAPGSAAAPTSEPPASTAPVLTYDTLIDGTYYIPVYMQANSVITYGDDVSTYAVEEGGELSADEIASREDVQLIGVICAEADYAAQPNTRVTYDAHGFIQNIYYEVPVGSGSYQLTPGHAMAEPTSEPTPNTSSQGYLNHINYMLDRWLTDDPTRSSLDSSTFFFLEGDAFSAAVPGQGAMFLATDEAGTQHIILAENDGRGNFPSLEHLAFTDENGEWRSGENGSGVDAETADFLLNVLRTSFLEPSEDDPASEPVVDMLHPIAGMTFDYESGILLRSNQYNEYGGSHNLIYIEAQDPPDLMDFDPPIQLLYSLERMDGGYAFSCVLLAYNEGYGWSKLEG